MTSCVFCQILAGEAPASVVYEDDRIIAFMDIYPMRPGHVLVVPRQHAQYVAALDSALRSHLFDTATVISEAIRKSVLKPDALHFIINDGEAAQQTVPHVHLHVLPRYRADTFKLLTAALRKPIQALTGPVPRHLLDAQAKDIRSLLARPDTQR